MMSMYSTYKGTKSPAENAATGEKWVHNDHLLKAGFGLKTGVWDGPYKETRISGRHRSDMEEPGYTRQRCCHRPGRHAALYSRHDRLPQEGRPTARHLLRCRAGSYSRRQMVGSGLYCLRRKPHQRMASPLEHPPQKPRRG